MKPLTIPLMLTWLRVILIPVFASLLLFENHPPAWANWLAAGVFVLAAVTDWLDGFLARRWQQTSDFGAFLDPVADKLMVAAALILLVSLSRTYAVAAMIIISREIAISALREWMAQSGRRNSVAVAYIGKVKTTVQMIAIILLLIWEIPPLGLSLKFIGNALMWVACILTLWSMFHYLIMALKSKARE